MYGKSRIEPIARSLVSTSSERKSLTYYNGLTDINFDEALRLILRELFTKISPTILTINGDYSYLTDHDTLRFEILLSGA